MIKWPVTPKMRGNFNIRSFGDATCIFFNFFVGECGVSFGGEHFNQKASVKTIFLKHL